VNRERLSTHLSRLSSPMSSNIVPTKLLSERRLGSSHNACSAKPVRIVTARAVTAERARSTPSTSCPSAPTWSSIDSSATTPLAAIANRSFPRASARFVSPARARWSTAPSNPDVGATAHRAPRRLRYGNRTYALDPRDRWRVAGRDLARRRRSGWAAREVGP